ncbi:MAG: LuxR C-terminal-related transcriptional regulator [Acidimicrobiia bacterium]
MRGMLIGRDRLLARVVAGCVRPGGVLLAGEAGVGKTRLLDEALQRRTDEGWPMHRFVATAATSTIPLGALFTVVPSEAPADQAQLLAAIRRRLVPDARQLTIVTVDDAHHLDELSATLLAELVHSGEAALVATVRSGEAAPASLTALWASGAVERLEVPVLEPDAVTALAADHLGGPIDSDLATALARSSRGNPLLLREVVLDARSAGDIAEVDGRWTACRSLRPGRRIHDLVRARVTGMSAAAVEVLELVAVGEPIPVAWLGDQDAQILDELERVGLVDVRIGDSGMVARPEHPLIGDAVRTAMATRHRAQVGLDLARRALASTALVPGDAGRVVGWFCDAGVDVPSDVCALAAEEALAAFDLARAAALAERSANDGGGGRALVVVADALRLQGRTEEADRASLAALAAAVGEREIARCAEVRALLLTHQLGRPQDAVALLRDRAELVEDPALRRRLDTMALNLSGLLGAFPEVLRLGERTLDAQPTEPSEELWIRQNVAFARVLLGRLGAVEADLDRCLTLFPQAPNASPDVEDFLWAMRTGAFVQRGQLRDGRTAVERWLSRRRGEDRVHLATGAIHAQLLWHAADVDALFALTDSLLAGDAGPDSWGVGPIVRGTAAEAHAKTGDLRAAEALLAGVDPDLRDDRALPFVAAGRAALIAAASPDAAAELVLAAGDRAFDTTHVAFGVVALHSSLTYAPAAPIARRLRTVAADLDGELLLTMVSHANAWADRDGDALDVAGNRFARCGAGAHAAKAFSHAAAAHDDAVAARRSAARAVAWARAVAPIVVDVPPVADAVSDRELDVAVRAAGGAASRDIAAALFLSVRTVDNHLRRAYAKLSVHSRAELAAALAPLPTTVGARRSASS